MATTIPKRWQKKYSQKYAQQGKTFPIVAVSKEDREAIALYADSHGLTKKETLHRLIKLGFEILYKNTPEILLTF